MSLLRQTMTPLSTREHDRLDSALAEVNAIRDQIAKLQVRAKSLALLCDDIEDECLLGHDDGSDWLYQMETAKERLERKLGQDEAASIDYERAVYGAGRV